MKELDEYESDRELPKRKLTREPRKFVIEQLSPAWICWSDPKWFRVGSYKKEKSAIQALEALEKIAKNSTYQFMKDTIYRIVRKF